MTIVSAGETGNQLVPERSMQWCESVAQRVPAKGRCRQGRPDLDLTADIFNAIGWLSQSGTSLEVIARMFRCLPRTVSGTASIFRRVVPEVIALTDASLPLDERLRVYDIRIFIDYDKTEQLERAQTLIRSQKRGRP